MLIHDIIKIKYITDGYLSDYPYHMISDQEMCNAFIFNKPNYFDANYPCLNTDLSKKYDDLKSAVIYHINAYLFDSDNCIPDWVYSYMLGTVISIHSSVLDIHDLLVPLGVDNINDEFTSQSQQACYNESVKWLAKVHTNRKVLYNGNYINDRPPTIFGEPHIIKSLRIREVM